MANIGTEHVLLCEASRIQDIMGAKELIPISKSLISEFADAGSFWFGPRNLVEADERYLQLVSYVLIAHSDRFLCYQRGHASCEERLREKLSIGLGGHISLTDKRATFGTLDVMKTIKAGAAREVSEELETPKVAERKKLALLHSRENAVDMVHCGLVEIWHLESPQLTIKDKSLKVIGFKSLSELAVMQGFETWSTLLIRHLNSSPQHTL